VDDECANRVFGHRDDGRIEEGAGMAETIWGEARKRLQDTVSQQHFETWIAPLRAHAWDGKSLTIQAPSAFFRDWVKKHHLHVIASAASAVTGGEVVVQVEVNRALAAPPPGGSGTPPRPRAARRASSAAEVADPRYTFDNFVVGASNEIAFRAARTAVEQPGSRFNPLFLYGGVGLGKTHLLRAVAGCVAAGRGPETVLSISAEDFVNEMIVALRHDHVERFRRRFRRIATLAVDDVQFLAGKVRSQEEFTHTFNALHASGRQIVLASDRPPHELPGIEEALRSRFASGLLADIRSPDPALRRELVRRKSATHGAELPADVIEFLADHWCENVRQLEGALARVDAYATLVERPVTLALVRETLANFVPVRAGGLTIDRIVGEVCLTFKVTRAELMSARRTARLAVPRQVAMYLCRRLTDVPLRTIGSGLGGRDHSTVVHALEVVERKLRADAALRETVAAVEARLSS